MKMQKNGEWPALVAAYPNILSRDWVRIPLSGDTIVGVNNGWPQLIEPIVKKLKENDVEFSGDEEKNQSFQTRIKLESGQKNEGFHIC